MRVRVRLFAGTRDAVGAGAVDVDLPESATLGDVFDALARDHPRLGAYRGCALLALDGRLQPPTAPVRGAREAAILPPVSGGRGALHEGPLSLDALRGELRAEGAGAVAAFLGVVRGDEGISSLHFEAYEAMAEAELSRIAEEAARKFGLLDCLLRHRVGDLAVGEPIVAVLAAARHRREAFEAVAWAMDEVKARVPIWKRQAGRWVNDPTSGG
ncbi:MAG TPA: molybdenum cofactor biosynthesis protein MoaE [Candidatus Thermoplasmatota archaeon]|nr:molybdenum cofactor biosynthesis protein MoaE [Candidatus Thermoplasmatota archaeon]